MSDGTPLGVYLRNRRARLDPASLGFGGRRRVSGLRREEVAQRANIGATWYAWLEKGRGGHSSVDVLDRTLVDSLIDEWAPAIGRRLGRRVQAAWGRDRVAMLHPRITVPAAQAAPSRRTTRRRRAARA